jgi:hypothetical protein
MQTKSFGLSIASPEMAEHLTLPGFDEAET